MDEVDDAAEVLRLLGISQRSDRHEWAIANAVLDMLMPRLRMARERAEKAERERDEAQREAAAHSRECTRLRSGELLLEVETEAREKAERERNRYRDLLVLAKYCIPQHRIVVRNGFSELAVEPLLAEIEAALRGEGEGSA